ncbi:zinc finger protein 189-like [Melanotaenia boesemani]|uniref:zinc finger protein 189-like n=1 Tax=Melanotaenia boesemani TaxID=1250792 RepID=UPI001C04C3CE|nr:zinc finger protein 189-like [Melanotaenia boesemani]
MPSAFGTQVAAIMDALSKAAVADITKLVEEESVVLHMEIRRRDSEIQELQRSLEMMEAELYKAQEAAVKRVTEEEQEQTTAGSKVQQRNKKEDQEEGGIYSEFNAQYSPCEPQNVMEESHNIKAMVKQEPACELSTTAITGNTARADVGSVEGEQHESIWHAPACDMYGKNCAEMQQFVDIFPFHAEEYSACKDTESSFNSLSTSKETTSDDCLSVPIKVEVTMPSMCMGSSPSKSVRNDQFRHDSLHDECMQSALQQEESSTALPRALRSTVGTSGSISEDISKNSFRAKRQTNVWRTNPKIFFCSVCNKGFPRLSQLEEHKTSHQTFKPFRCLECGKSFTQKTRLKTHQSVHTGERPFSCKICGKMFSRQGNCLRHERFHSGLKPYSCRQCGKSFTVLGNLKIHQEIHLQGR